MAQPAQLLADETFCTVLLGDDLPTPHVLHCVWRPDSFDVQLADGQSVWSQAGVRKPAATDQLSERQWLTGAREALAEGAHTLRLLRQPEGPGVRLRWVFDSFGATTSTTEAPYMAHRGGAEAASATFALLAGAASAAANAVAQRRCAQAAETALQGELELALGAQREAVAAKQATEKDLFGRFAVVLNEKKKRITVLGERLECAVAERDEARDHLDSLLEASKELLPLAADEGGAGSAGEEAVGNAIADFMQKCAIVEAQPRAATPPRASEESDDEAPSGWGTQTQAGASAGPAAGAGPASVGVKLESQAVKAEAASQGPRKRPKKPKGGPSLGQIMADYAATQGAGGDMDDEEGEE